MKKTIFKTLSVLILTIFISSCETDDGVLDTTQEQSKEVITDNATTKMRPFDDPSFTIDGFDGPYDVINGEYVPHIGTYVRVTAKNPFGFWKTTGCFEQIGSRFLRTSKDKGSIIHYVKRDEGGFNSVGRDFIAIPEVSTPPVSCPSSGHTIMEQVFNSVLDAKNYDTKYTYKWKVVHNSRTTYKTGRSVLLNKGGSTVTLSVSKNGCTTQSSGPKNYFVR